MPLRTDVRARGIRTCRRGRKSSGSVLPQKGRVPEETLWRATLHEWELLDVTEGHIKELEVATGEACCAASMLIVNSSIDRLKKHKCHGKAVLRIWVAVARQHACLTIA